MQVADVMRTDVVTIQVDATMDDAFAKMLAEGVDSLVVTRGSPPRKTGILTDTDVKEALRGYSQPLSSFYVDEFMSRPLKTVRPDTTLSKAVEVFEAQGIDHLIVTEKLQLKGIITPKDIAMAYDEIVKQTRTTASKGPSWRRQEHGSGGEADTVLEDAPEPEDESDHEDEPEHEDAAEVQADTPTGPGMEDSRDRGRGATATDEDESTEDERDASLEDERDASLEDEREASPDPSDGTE